MSVLTGLGVVRVLRNEPYGLSFDDALTAMRQARDTGRAIVPVGGPDGDGREPGAIICALNDEHTRFSVRAVTIAPFDAPVNNLPALNAPADDSRAGQDELNI
jgi:hypothetical protein